MEAPHQSTYPCSVGWIIWVSDTNGEVASRLRKYTEEPAEPPPQFSSSLVFRHTLLFPLSHTHTYTQTCSAYSVSPSLFQCSVKRAILSSFTYLREEFPALVMIRHRSSLIKRRKSSPKLTKEEILTECSFCKKPAGFRWTATVYDALKDTATYCWLFSLRLFGVKMINIHLLIFMCEIFSFDLPWSQKKKVYSTLCPRVKLYC